MAAPPTHAVHVEYVWRGIGDRPCYADRTMIPRGTLRLVLVGLSVVAGPGRALADPPPVGTPVVAATVGDALTDARSHGGAQVFSSCA